MVMDGYDPARDQLLSIKSRLRGMLDVIEHLDPVMGDGEPWDPLYHVEDLYQEILQVRIDDSRTPREWLVEFKEFDERVDRLLGKVSNAKAEAYVFMPTDWNGQPFGFKYPAGHSVENMFENLERHIKLFSGQQLDIDECRIVRIDLASRWSSRYELIQTDWIKKGRPEDVVEFRQWPSDDQYRLVKCLHDNNCLNVDALSRRFKDRVHLYESHASDNDK
mgnify:CR=1 FL=1